jgi:hypothetical protein
MNRRDFLAMSSLGAAAVAGLSTRTSARQAGRAFTFDPNALGRTLKTPDGKVVFDYVTRKAPDTDMTANSVCCFHPLMTPAGERVTVFGQGHGHYRGVFFAWHTVEYHELVPAPAPRAGGAGARGGGRAGAGGGAGAGRAGGGPGGGGQRPGGAAPQPSSPEVLARQNQPTRSTTYVGDYWGWGRYALMEARVIRNLDAQLVRADANSAQLAMRNEWTVRDQSLMDETLSATVKQVPNAYVLDLIYTFSPKNVDVVLPEWSFGGCCVSGRSDAEAAYYESPEGRVDRGNPSMIDGTTSWPDADWYSRTHVLSGKTAGYAVVNHPSNPKTRWWNPPTTGNINPSIVTYGEVKIPHDQPLTLKYRVVSFDGTMAAQTMNEIAAEFLKS